MPRTNTVESLGCPLLRVLTTDVLGLIKVVEARHKCPTPKAVETWGSPDASLGVIAASFTSDKTNPLLAIGRKNGSLDVLNPLNGDVLKSFLIHEASFEGHFDENDPVVGLHLFSKEQSEAFSRAIILVLCTENGKACLRSLSLANEPECSNAADSLKSWSVCCAGKILCSSLDGLGKHALFAGKGVEVNTWDLDKSQKIWTAKPPPCNSLGIFTPAWFTAATFLSREDHRKLVAGTNDHKVRLYDATAQRRPVISVDFRESPIKAITTDMDNYTVYIGTGSGDLASLDMRTGKLLGCFIGKCCGSIRSIARHPKLPVIASCGLDSYLRFWDTRTRQPLSAVFLKQHLTNVVIDSHFSEEDSSVNNISEQLDSVPSYPKKTQNDGDEPSRRKEIKDKKKNKMRRAKTRRHTDDEIHDQADGDVVDDDVGKTNGFPSSKRDGPPHLCEDNTKTESKRKKRAHVPHDVS